MRFGAYIPLYGGWSKSPDFTVPISFEFLRSVARQAEEGGYHSIWVPDHLLNPVKGEKFPSQESWTVLSALAALTTKVKLGHTTVCYAFRNPALVAKMGATLDHISGGRFILSVGAGWYEREFEAYGFTFLDHDSRVEAAGEAMHLIKRLWTEGVVTHSGSYFRVTKAILEPKPLQKPRPPVWYAGSSQASQRTAAEHADTWLFGAVAPAKAAEKILRFEKKHAKRLGYAMSAMVILEDTEEKAVKQARRFFPGRWDEILASGLVGSRAEVLERIDKLAEAGVEHLLLQFLPDTVVRVARFGREILASYD